jgi:hypothetical protein
VRADSTLLGDYQVQLVREGVPLAWPSPLPG